MIGQRTEETDVRQTLVAENSFGWQLCDKINLTMEYISGKIITYKNYYTKTSNQHPRHKTQTVIFNHLSSQLLVSSGPSSGEMLFGFRVLGPVHVTGHKNVSCKINDLSPRGRISSSSSGKIRQIVVNLRELDDLKSVNKSNNMNSAIFF